MSKKYLFLILTVLTIGLISGLNSCYYDNEEYLYQGANCDTTLAVTYNGRIKAIMDSRCANTSCHGGPSPANGINLTNYSGVRSGVEAIGMLCNIRQESGCSPMPKNEGPISTCDILAIEKWQATGFIEN